MVKELLNRAPTIHINQLKIPKEPVHVIAGALVRLNGEFTMVCLVLNLTISKN